MRLFGANAWSARLLPSGFAMGCVLLVVWLGTLLYNPTTGLAAGFVLTFTSEFISYGARFQLDPAMIFFILLSFIAWWKRKPVWVGIAAGLGMWMKSPVSLLIFPSAFLALLLTRRLSRKEATNLFFSALIAITVGSSIWIMAGSIGGWGMITDYIQRQVIGTALGGRGYQQSVDYFAFMEAFRKRFWPWLPIFLASLLLIVRTGRWKKPEVALPMSGAIVVIVVISSMRFKFSHYYLPMYPFIALLTVDCARNWLEIKKEGFERFLIAAALVLPALLLVTPIELAPEMFPALRRFAPIIQSYGSCRDKVLYIEGGQPYGSFGDYRVEIMFYANRDTINASCDEAPRLIALEKPAWILVSGEHYPQCVRDAAKQYPVRYLFGNQFLLSRVVPPQGVDSVIDLTALARDLQAPLDCEASALPKNRYYRYQ